MVADLLDQLVHVVADDADIRVVMGHHGEMGAFAGLDDEQNSPVELRHRLPYAAASVAELDGRAMGEALDARRDGRQLIGLVHGQPGGEAQFEPVPRQHQRVA
ncbi:hypothetical protein SSPO_050060 [Streptomyces antimycoticus]|uniref:Uncharacterized protein n=1 Tax=Streptomyces antimycoticus TaxID=68175 RepID=A0A499UQS6_9ACTN|nr:hypothetical protein SSPO_050060 [Streptomyces antimycoticus]